MEREKICREFLRKILSGQLPPGSMLAPEEKLARELGVSRMKLHRSLDILRENGVIISRPRRGSRVAAELSGDMLRRLRARFLRGAAVLHAAPPDGIHWDLRTIRRLKEELTLRGFLPEVFSYEGGSRRTPCTLGSVAEGLAKELYGPVFILPSFSGQIRAVEDRLRKLPFRFFVLNYAGISTRFRLPDLAEVCYDHYGDGVILGRVLGRSGCSRIIMLASLSNMPWSKDRYDGMCDGLGDYFPGLRVESVPSSAEGVRRVISFCRGGGAGSLVVCANSDYAVSALSFFTREKMVCGRDYRLLSFADDPRCRELGITAMAFPHDAAACGLADLAAASQGKPAAPLPARTLSLNSALIVRNTFIPPSKLFSADGAESGVSR